mgnify:CR=1 FL=1
MTNEVVIEAWNTVLFDKFTRFKYLFVEGYAAISEQVFERHPPPVGSKMLDVGCGFGDCTVRIAKLIGDKGIACGVDCASNFIQQCKLLAEQEALNNTNFFVADIDIETSCVIGHRVRPVFFVATVLMLAVLRHLAPRY